MKTQVAHLLIASLLMLNIASTSQAQSNRSVACGIERESKKEFPHWDLRFSYAYQSLLTAKWRYGEASVSVEGRRHFSGSATAQKYLTDTIEMIDWIMAEHPSNNWTTKLSDLGEDNRMWTGHYEENALIMLRERDIVFKVDASSIPAATEFARFMVSLMRNPPSACSKLEDDPNER